MSHLFGTTVLPRFGNRTLRVCRYDPTNEHHVFGVGALLVQVGPIQETETASRRAKTAIASPTNILVGDVLGEIVVVVFTMHNRSEAHAWNLIVSTNSRGLGIGTAFLGLILSLLEERGVIRVLLRALNPTPLARALLVRQGFTNDALDPSFWHHTITSASLPPGPALDPKPAT